ncbi:MAG: hypothetical protein JW802_02340 [Campylobacterales bacterium]|nr:hypothetical protein [Campylobacterales bacterium]MBN2831827.1 hypothetical protein [Campylobacterales bacterium]
MTINTDFRNSIFFSKTPFFALAQLSALRLGTEEIYSADTVQKNIMKH